MIDPGAVRSMPFSGTNLPLAPVNSNGTEISVDPGVIIKEGT